MMAAYTFDVFSSLDGYGGVSGGYWGKQGLRGLIFGQIVDAIAGVITAAVADAVNVCPAAPVGVRV
jgi:hypothetical protein